MYNITGVSLDQGLQTKACGSNPARQDISSGSRRNFVINEKIIYSEHIPKQSFYVICPVLELLCSGYLTKKFEDPWARP